MEAGRGELSRSISAVVWLIGLSVALLAVLTPSAFAHAERTESRPAARAEVDSAPSEITISFTEPPTSDAKVSVLDGCGDEVVQSVDSAGTEMTIALSGGQPGAWKVDTTVISGLDGHATRDGWGFRVSGEADCSDDPGPGPSDDGAAAPEPDAEGDGGGGFPILALIGGAAVIGIALLVRVLLGGKD